MAKVSLRAYNREIEAMIDRGQLDEAIAHCQHILKTFPKHLETYRLLGKSFLEYKRYKDAVDIFTRVLVVEPNDFVANVGMSIIRDEEDKLDDAIWHMERAFEVQPSNAAIQGELQRLYGRREGVQPPRIRMTRGALAHMYVQGELYPQAISEIKSVLADDAGRTDMQVLMARAYFKSGQKTEAADAASAVLRRYPYCLDANRILVEILGGDRSENSQLYRQRVIELDPYAAQVSGTIFQTNEVGDAAVTLEHFEWDGRTSTQSSWETSDALRLDSGFDTQTQTTQSSQAQPDWLKSSFADSTPPQPTPKIVPPVSTPAPSFDFAAPTPTASEPAQPTPEADIPDFLREAGWGQSTGSFDESKSMFAEEPATPVSTPDALPIEQGDMPDWVKAMAPPQATQTSQPAAEEEELPDWINNIGTGALAAAKTAPASDEFDWLNQTEQPSTPTADEQPDWMKQFAEPTPSESTPADQPDWMKQFDQPASQTPTSTDKPDWMAGFGNEPASTQGTDEQSDWMNRFTEPAASETVAADQPASQIPASTDQPDWLTGFGDVSDATPASATLEDQSDWMKQFAEPASPASAGNEFDFLNELTEPALPTPPAPAVDTANLGVSEQERDDSFAWLENLAAKQGASEGLLTKPEERMEEEPDWVKQARGENIPAQPLVSQPPAQSFDQVQEQPVANMAEPDKSQSDIDDSLAWLENLAAKQGATEGLLVKPEDRKDKEPDWVAKIKASTQSPVTPPPPAPEPQQPVEPVSEPGKSQSDIDDSLAWLENLAAKQGATEGLLVKPEDRKDKEPDWVAKIKATTQPPAAPPPAPELQQPAANVADLGKSQSDIDDSLAWLENLAAKQGATEGLLIKPEDRMEKEPDWVQQVKKSTGELHSEPSTQQPEIQPVANVEELGKSQSEIDDSLAWLENLAAKQGATEGLLIKPEDRMEKEPDWVQQVKSTPEAPAQPAANVEELGKSQSEIDDSLAWLENLAAKQGATEGLLVKPEDRMDKEPDWVQQVKSAPQQPSAQPESIEQPIVEDDTTAWLRSLDEEEVKPELTSAADETAMWFKKLEEPEPISTPQAEPADDMPAWLQGIEEEQASVAESAVPAAEAVDESDWMNAIEEQVATPEPVAEEEDIPSWLKGMDEESKIASSLPQDELPAWMRDETGEVVAEPTKIEPTRPTDWHPIEEKQPEPPAPQPVVPEQPKPEPVALIQEKPKPAPVKKATPKPAEAKPATPPTPYREPLTQRGTAMLTMPTDPILGSARIELSRSNIPGALETYAKLIKKGRFLDEVIFDLREALYRYPVEVSIWQSLGDAYMRANRLQDALDAYTKAEELLR